MVRIGIRTFSSALALTFLGALGQAQQNVWVVDAVGAAGFDFTEIQPAVDAADDGDVILIKGRLNHEYAGFTVAARSLVIAGQEDDLTPALVLAPPVIGPIIIRDLAADQRVLLSGVIARTNDPVFLSNLSIRDCEGLVFLERMQAERFDAYVGPSLPPVPATFEVLSSAHTTVVNSTISGQSALSGLPGAGTRLMDSEVFLEHVQLRGGDGAPVGFVPPGGFSSATEGSTGIVVEGSELYAFGAGLRGGLGGHGFINPLMQCFPGGDGGLGALVQSSPSNASLVKIFDSGLNGGGGGFSPGPNCSAGNDGDNLELNGSASAVDFLPGTARAFSVTSPVREDEVFVASFEGESGDLAFLLVGDLEAPLLDAAFDGPLHLGLGFSARLVGTLGASGQLQRMFTAQELGAGIESFVVPMQAVFYSPLTDRFTAGDPASVLILDRDL